MIYDSILQEHSNKIQKLLILLISRVSRLYIRVRGKTVFKAILLEFLVDNIFVVFARKVFQHTVGIPMGTNCAPLLADIFLYSYEADFIQSLLSTGKKHLASRFNLTYRYLQVHRWCIVHKQPRIRTLSGPDVSCWTWDQGHHREHHFCFLPRFTSVDWEGWSTSHFHLRQARWFQFPHHKLSVPE